MMARSGSSGERERGMAPQLLRAYLWIALFLTIPVGLLRDAAGTGALLCGYAAFLALTAAAIFAVGAEKAGQGGTVREGATFLPGLLLAVGPLVLLLGASVTGEPTASLPGDYVLNTTAILLGSVILIGGFLTLAERLWEAGQRLLPMLGLAGLLVGAAVWLANLVFRYAIVASGAAGLQARVEARAWVAHEYLRGLEGPPSWMELLLVWTDMLQITFVLLSYLSAAAFGVAMVRAGWLGRLGSGLFISLNVALTVMVLAGIILADVSVVAAWTAYILTIPFMVFIMPYFVGVALMRPLRRKSAARGQRDPVIESVLLR